MNNIIGDQVDTNSFGPKKKMRAIEIDVIRGLAIFLMICHHFMYDVKDLFGYDYFHWIDGPLLQTIIRPVILAVFFTISGISGIFSRNNLKRALRLAIVGIVLTFLSVVVSLIIDVEVYIFWQVIHGLALSTFISFLIEKSKWSETGKNIFLLIFGLGIVFIGPRIISAYNLGSEGPSFFLPLGIGHLNPKVPGMLDYLPLIPYSGFFYIGSALGSIVYPRGIVKKQYCTARVFRPLEFMGRNAIWVYALHQPILISLIWLFGRIFG